MVDPSRAGFTITGRPSMSITRSQAVVARTMANRGVGIPEASHTSFVRHLSMASAEAMTPLPVYGMRITSSAPWTVPSSPKRPCSAMKTRLNPSRLRSKSSRSAGSKGSACTPRERSASSTARPEMREISRSAEGPPMSTATRPKSLAMARLPHDAHLAHQADPGASLDGLLHVIHERFDVRGARAPEVHDEVRVLRGDLRAPDAVALEAAGLDEPRRVVAFGIAEHAPGVRLVQGLGGHAPREELADARHRCRRVPILECEPRRDEPLLRVRAQPRVPVSGLVLPRQAPVQMACAIDGLDFEDVVPRLAAITARVHRERPADRAGYAGEPLGAAAPVLGHEARDVRRRHTRTGRNHDVRFHRCFATTRGQTTCSTDENKWSVPEGAMRQHHRAVEPAVANQEVAAEAEEEDRHPRIEPLEERSEERRV